MHAGAKRNDGRIRWTCRGNRADGRVYCYSSTNPGADTRARNGRRFDAPKGDRTFRRKLRENVKVYVITAAQNATPIHPEFWACLQQVVKHRRAELLVVPIRYKNPTSRWTASQANEDRWATETIPFLWNVRKVINENLILLGDVKTQPTASDPLTGFDAISGAASAILAHTKMELRSIATPSNRMAKIVTTTGACTVANFTDSRLGKIGAFHHSLAALIVEVQGKRFFLRQLHFDNKTASVIDLETRYHVDRSERAPRPLALVQGDTHWGFICPQVEKATFGTNGIVPVLRPRYLIWQDLLDAYAVTPHHIGNPFIAIAKAMSSRGSAEDETRGACQHVRDRTTGDMVSVVVPANHNDMLRRWIISHDWKTNPINAEFYLRAALQMVRGTRMTENGTEYPSPFPMLFPSMVKSMDGIRLLKDDESFSLAGVELGLHGDKGPNGSRGSIKNLRRIGVKSIIGHSHSPGINEGTYQTGTSTRLRLEYNGGPSSWLNAHVLLNADGKRQLLILIDGQYRAE